MNVRPGTSTSPAMGRQDQQVFADRTSQIDPSALGRGYPATEH